MAKYDYLILAEKNTLTQDIAKAFKKYKREGNFYVAEDPEIGKAKITWLFGHILEVDIEGTMGEREWKGEPVFPKFLKFRPKKERKNLFQDIKKEIQSGNYRYVVHAGDPDREGELLVRELLNFLKVPKEKVLRLWFNSQEPHVLRKALLNMKPLSAYDHLFEAGRLRQYGDLVVGINGSRVLQARAGNRNLSIGRVQTPVLKIIADRYLENKNFKPEEYYVVYILLEKGRKFKATYVKEKEGLIKKEEAQKILDAVKPAKYATVLSVKKRKGKQSPPKMYTLTHLIKDAGKFGFSADKTAKIVQKLYEKDHVLSYPRTESPYLSTGDECLVKKVLSLLGRKDLLGALSDKNVRKRIFNDESVAKAGHHAIIPVNVLPDTATKEEKIIYDLVLKRFLAQFYPEYVYETTTVLFDCGGKKFQTKGKVDVSLGWKELYKNVNLDDDKQEEEEDRQSLPPLTEGEKVNKIGEGAQKRFTQPPPLFTSASLLPYLEKLGIGTEATRPTYEKVLIERGYVQRLKGNKLVPTEKGLKLLEAVKDTPIVSPEITGQWERILSEIALERNFKKRDDFLNGIKNLTSEVCSILWKAHSVEALKKKPSAKMINYALSLAEKNGIDVDRERLKEDYDYVKEIIERFKEPPKPPSEKQLNFAKQLAEENGVEIPKKALESSSELSKWIDRILKKKKTSKKSSKKRSSQSSKRKRKK